MGCCVVSGPTNRPLPRQGDRSRQGLLQTREHAAALLDSDDLLTHRLERQGIVTRTDEKPIELVAVIDESVLRRPIGGPSVLAGQLRHLVSMSERPNVTVQVLPLDGPERAVALGAMGALIILGFPWAGGLVYLEHRGGATYLDSPHDIEVHAAALDALRGMALPARQSVDKIRAAAKETEP